MRKQEILDKTNETLARLLENNKAKQWAALGEAKQNYEIAIRRFEEAKRCTAEMIAKADIILEERGQIGACDFERYATQLAESASNLERAYTNLYTILNIVE